MTAHRVKMTTLVLLVTTGLLLGLARGAVASGDGHARWWRFGERVAGTYLATLDLEALPQTLRGMATLGADGTVVATDEDDFGFLIGDLHSPKHGAWKRVGKRSADIRVLEFAYDGTKQLYLIYVLDLHADFERGFGAGGGSLNYRAYLPTQDPLDASEPTVLEGGGTFRFQRVVP